MPRNGAGIYSIPIGTDGVADQTIESTKYNVSVHDFETDANTPRPIVAGGTGATSAVGARETLQVEVAAQTVTDYATHVFENGSFWSASGTPGAPTATGIYGGNAVIINRDPNYINLVARDLNGMAWTRQKTAGVWSSWSGDRSINKADPSIILNKPASGTSDSIFGQTAGLNRWQIQIGSEHAETGSNAGSNFNVLRYTDAGAFLNAPLSIARGTGDITLTGNLRATGGRIFVNGSALNGQIAVLYDSTARSCMSLQAAGASIAGELIAFLSSGGALSGSITYGAGQTSVAYNTASDGRLKEDLRALSTADAGRIVDDTEVYDFRWKETGERAFGVIAQQAAPVYATPMFHNEEVDRWFVDYSKYVPVLLRELQALRARVAQLETGMASKPA